MKEEHDMREDSVLEQDQRKYLHNLSKPDLTKGRLSKSQFFNAKGLGKKL